MWVNGDTLKKRWSTKGVVPSILTGVFPNESMSRMSKNRLEAIVVRLIDSTTADDGFESENNGDCKQCMARPKWWPDNLAFDYPLAELKQAQTCPMQWRAILKYLISACANFYKNDLCAGTLLSTARCRGYDARGPPRKVLAPTQAIANVTNRLRKRKSTDNDDCGYAIDDVKRPRPNGFRECKVVLRKKPVERIILEQKCLSRNAVVSLRDVFLEIPAEKQRIESVAKDDFLKYFGLGEHHTKVDARQLQPPFKPHFLRLCTIPNIIPFSSDVGKVIMKRENQVIPDEVHLKRIERTEWYLNDGARRSSAKDGNYDVTYEERGDIYYRYYNFPKRQLHQNRKSLQEAFLEYVLKPAHVCMERMDLQKLVSAPKPVDKGNGNVVTRRCSLRLKAVHRKPT